MMHIYLPVHCGQAPEHSFATCKVFPLNVVLYEQIIADYRMLSFGCLERPSGQWVAS